jgi:hypothetical protein
MYGGYILETLPNIYIYRYAEEELYATRYQGVVEELEDIDASMRHGNIYEQFLPLTRIVNVDSVAEYIPELCPSDSDECKIANIDSITDYVTEKCFSGSDSVACKKINEAYLRKSAFQDALRQKDWRGELILQKEKRGEIK